MRRAGPADTDWLCQELEKFSRFFGSKHQLYDDAYVREQLPIWYENAVILVAVEARMPGIVIGRDEIPLGFIGGPFVPHLLNPKIIQLAETFWWVAEEHRGTSAGARLLAAFIQEAKVLGVDWLTMVLEEHSPVKEESLLKRGFRRTERAYLLELTDGSSLDDRRGGLTGTVCGGGGGGGSPAASSAEEGGRRTA